MEEKMFGLFSKVSNKDIEQAVWRELHLMGSNGEIFGVAERLLAFADAEKLGQWQRARFCVEIISYISKEGMPRLEAEVLGNAVDLFVSRQEPILGVHGQSYQCGVVCAMTLVSGMSGAEYSGLEVMDEYIGGNIVKRSSILKSYGLGLRALKNKALEKAMLQEFLEITVSNAYGIGELSDQELNAWRKCEILPHVAQRYLESKSKEEQTVT